MEKDVGPRQTRDGHESHSGRGIADLLRQERSQFGLQGRVLRLVAPPDQIHLVEDDQDLVHAQAARQVHVLPQLPAAVQRRLQVGGVHRQQGRVGRARAGDHGGT